MLKNVTLYDLLISCPSDVKEEIKIIKDTIEEFNRHYPDKFGIIIRPIHWSENSFPQSGGEPQPLLNKQIVDKCDAVVAIFWTRFGTPTDQYGSGTEEEIERMFKDGKQVFLYFCQKNIPYSQIFSAECEKVKKFQEKYKNRGIYFTYATNEEFKNRFYHDLISYFPEQKHHTENKQITYPSGENASPLKNNSISLLKLMGINKNSLTEYIVIQQFSSKFENIKSSFEQEIKQLYEQIMNFNLSPRHSHDSGLASIISLDRYVEINDESLSILKFAEEFKIALPDDFFCLGNLKRSNITFSPKYYGTDDEKRKYNLIEKLDKKISKYFVYRQINQKFSQYKFIELALQNYGLIPDEDVNITLSISQNNLLNYNEFPIFSPNEIENLLDVGIEEIFEIKQTAKYKNYQSSQKDDKLYSGSTATRNSQDDLLDEMKEIFKYEILPDESNFAVNLKMQCIKHNTTVAFPSLILLKEPIDKLVYEITSSHMPIKQSGELAVKATNEIHV